MNGSPSPTHVRIQLPSEEVAMMASPIMSTEDAAVDHPSAALPLLERSRSDNLPNMDTYGGIDTDDSMYFVTPTSDLESPGNISMGGASLGEQSTISDKSTHSRAMLLRPGSKERGAMIDQRVTTVTDDLDEEANMCRIGCWSPDCFQACANVKMFVFFMCMLMVVASALSTGYLTSVLTTIEKRFEIGSSISGLIASAYELGNLICVIFVSFLGTSRHIPKWIGRGVLVMGLGSLLFTLPHVIAPKYTVSQGMSVNETGEDNMCKVKGHSNGDDECIDEHSGNWMYVSILIASQILIGTGGTPILTLGITYIDNHVAQEKSPVYLACVHASGALGPVLGYALGALLLEFCYVDSFTHDVSPHLTPSSPRWIGAWWGGFIICGILLFFLAVPFLGYPRVLVKEKRRMLETKSKEALKLKREDDVTSVTGTEDKTYGRSVKELPRAVLNLLKNPVYAILLPAICCEICIVSGFVTFLPKYIETQFGTSTSMASLFTGCIAIPGAVIGILIGGYVLKRMELSPKGAIQLVLILNCAALCGFSLFFVLGCENPRMAGANFPYLNSSGHKIFEANLTSTCNQNCACSPNALEPICGINGITYFSPCHAGCTGSNDFYEPGKEERKFNYSGCSCINNGHLSHGGHEVIISPMATSGPCKSTCDRLLPFLILLVWMTFTVAGTQMPLLMCTLRTVKHEERSFAIGLQHVIMRVFAYIPSPILYGNSIDSTCLLWSVKCESNGSCLLYDIVTFRYKYIGIAAGLKVISLGFFIAVWYHLRKKTIKEAELARQADYGGGGLLGTGGKTGHTFGTNGEISANSSPLLRPSELNIPCPASPSHPERDQGAYGDETDQDGQARQKTNSLNKPNVNFVYNSRGGLANIPESGESVL